MNRFHFPVVKSLTIENVPAGKEGNQILKLPRGDFHISLRNCLFGWRWVCYMCLWEYWGWGAWWSRETLLYQEAEPPSFLVYHPFRVILLYFGLMSQRDGDVRTETPDMGDVRTTQSLRTERVHSRALVNLVMTGSQSIPFTTWHFLCSKKVNSHWQSLWIDLRT